LGRLILARTKFTGARVSVGTAEKCGEERLRGLGFLAAADNLL
jgi:hypothetical protein